LLVLLLHQVVLSLGAVEEHVQPLLLLEVVAHGEELDHLTLYFIE